MNTELFEIRDNRNEGSDPVLCILDTKEGSDCFGHWIYECAIFLPAILRIRKQYPSLKLVLNCSRKYKLNTLIDFNFLDSDIIYNDKYTSETLLSWLESPIENALIFIPKFFFVQITLIETPMFLPCLMDFQRHYKNLIGHVDKTIDFLYLIRSRKELYNSPNKRTFINIDAVIKLCDKYSIEIFDVDKATSIREQVKKVLQSKVVIHEYGSALVNSTFFANNSHSLILNHIQLGEGHTILNDHMMQLNAVTHDIFPTTTGDWHSIEIDINALEKRILELNHSIKH